VNPEGETATAKAIAKKNSLMIVSMAANTAIEDIIDAALSKNPNAKIWMQLYIQPDREFTKTFVRRVEDAGCSALVVTVDSPVFGRRIRDIRNEFNELPEGLSCPNMKDSEGTTRNIAFDSELSWEDILWLKEQTSLPIVLKGILHPQDIELAIEQGVQAVIVSNHGGRQLDCAPATIRLLPALVKAADGRIPLVFDGGVRSGLDIFKALAMGATAVAIGRPVVWGLCAGGQNGVEEVFELLASQLMSAVQLTGCRSREDICSDLLLEDRNGGSLL
jgi:4-hydroxymandelate oxidase